MGQSCGAELELGPKNKQDLVFRREDLVPKSEKCFGHQQAVSPSEVELPFCNLYYGPGQDSEKGFYEGLM